LEVTIDWGEPLTQRMVDGLLVAQRNPGPVRGLYQQSNAELTCVFGNPQARPDEVNLSEQQAHLVYHVLVNGIVEVPLMLTVSDVGEQMAWTGFLALREADRAFELSERSWNTALKTGRLWTPDINFNHAIQAGKLTALRQIQRLRTGLAASDHRPSHTPGLIDCMDTVDVTTSRNLLAHLRRVAEATTGKLPALLPIHSKEEMLDPGDTFVANNHAYLRALYRHLQRHFDTDLLAAHYGAVGLCAEQLLRRQVQLIADEHEQSIALALINQSLVYASQLAQQQQDQVNAGRWAAIPQEHAGYTGDQSATSVLITSLLAAWRPTSDRPSGFTDNWQGIDMAGALLWQGCGITWRADVLWVEPTWPQAGSWWAILGLPLAQGKLSLVWDGATMHSTLPIQAPYPVVLHDTIRARNSDELDFDLHFELQSERDGVKDRSVIRPQFS
jgi:hypothetical protein